MLLNWVVSVAWVQECKIGALPSRWSLFREVTSLPSLQQTPHPAFEPTRCMFFPLVLLHSTPWRPTLPHRQLLSLLLFANKVHSQTINMSPIEEEKDVSQHLEIKEAFEVDTPLPSPVSANLPKPKSQLSATAIIPVWIALSSAVIIYNNYLYNTLDFKYPVFTVTWHLTFAVSLIYLFLVSFRRICLTVGSYLHTGDWYSYPPTNYAPTGWRERGPYDPRYVHQINLADRSLVQRESYPQQHRLPIPQRIVHPDAEGHSFLSVDAFNLTDF